MNDILPPLLILDILAQPDVFAAGMLGALIGLAPFAVAEFLAKRRSVIRRVGHNNFVFVPEDLQ